MLEYPIEKLETLQFTCGFFQLILFENLFWPAKNSCIQSHKKLRRKAAETLLNETFMTDEQEIKKFFENIWRDDK